MAGQTVAELREIVEAILQRSGLVTEQAAAIARVLSAAERDGCKSHGVYRIEGLLRTIKAGKVDCAAVPILLGEEHPGIIRVTAGGGFASAAIELAVAALAERTAAQGIAAAVVNDAAHFSVLWPEVEALAAHGLASLALCPSYATVAPAGGTRPLLGTNPVAFGWPRPERLPYVFDIASSVAARGEIELHRRTARPLPEGWAVDAAGEPTTDPAAALDGAMLAFGGHKGSAIATLVELLAGALIGDLTSPETLAALGTTTLVPTHGELIIAFSPRTFARGRPGDPFLRAEALFAAIEAQGARLPSQRRFRARARTARDGLALSSAEMAALDRYLALGLGAV